MAICPKCHQETPEGAQFCGNCAAPLTESAAQQPVDPFVGKCIDNKYYIQKRIAAGGMGVVYLARQKGVGQEVAIKKLHSEYYSDKNVVERFINEARSYGKITHPNAVKLHDLLNVNGQICIIMEFVHGKTLTTYVDNKYLFSIRQIIDISLQLADALGTVHRAGIIHRDLKTENVMLLETVPGRFSVKILDFGIAKMMDRTKSHSTLEGTIVGTPEFMSPEQCQGESVDLRTDIYSFGILMYVMICGKLPYVADVALAVLQKQINEPTPACTRPGGGSVPVELEAIVDKCMEKDPKDRYQSFSEVIADLMSIQEGRKPDIALSQNLTPAKSEENVVSSDSDSPENADDSIHDHPSISDFSIEENEGIDLQFSIDKGELQMDEESSEPGFSEDDSEDGYSLGDIPDIDNSQASMPTVESKSGMPILPLVIVIAVIVIAGVFFGLNQAGILGTDTPSPQEPVIAVENSAADNGTEQIPQNEESGQDSDTNAEVPQAEEPPKAPEPVAPSEVGARQNLERGVCRAILSRALETINSGEIDESGSLLEALAAKKEYLFDSDMESYQSLKERQESFKNILAQANKAYKHQNCKAISELAPTIPEDAAGMKTKLDALVQKCNAVLAAPPSVL
ncbi:MAG: protein kinase [Proteobacteria bacterium]|nr:protein kinase [Pseudomonadota bacterium]